ncbi:hypothetical protein [Rhizobium rhizosphaerae]|uniref:hypothetical protein n=1 Tax=Xaviernesmea rhizosphaerae TaxID=1672749 RepID=UPI000AED7405|nr:hypothetical protein [Xaviernesmea rhizosphaerae]
MISIAIAFTGPATTAVAARQNTAAMTLELTGKQPSGDHTLLSGLGPDAARFTLKGRF